VVANDTAGGLLLLSLATGHPALGRVGRLVLTNCDSYDQFPPDALRRASALCRKVPRLARAGLRLQLRSSAARRKITSGVASNGLDQERAESFFGPARRDRRVADDLVAALAGFRPQLLIDAAEAIPEFERPVLLIWGESCDFFPIALAQRLAAEFPDATLVSIAKAKTWVPIDSPVVVADAITEFV
jgi:pimeloyl-ACP methyl ester carboxylesterase